VLPPRFFSEHATATARETHSHGMTNLIRIKPLVTPARRIVWCPWPISCYSPSPTILAKCLHERPAVSSNRWILLTSARSGHQAAPPPTARATACSPTTQSSDIPTRGVTSPGHAAHRPSCHYAELNTRHRACLHAKRLPWPTST
jgi:hypothetical protein